MGCVVVDAGTGNLCSVVNALQRLGCQPLVSDDPEDVKRGRKIILPGVGAFGEFMRGLQSRGLDEAVKTMVDKGRPLLGICVGMQALFEYGEEKGLHPGLGLLKGSVVRFPTGGGLKVPHTGWNQLWRRKAGSLLGGLPEGAFVYFNHSYYCLPLDLQVEAAVTDYGSLFTSAVQLGGVYGVQFHPEKSQLTGGQILKNFLKAES